MTTCYLAQLYVKVAVHWGLRMLELLDILHLHYRHVISLILCWFCHRHTLILCMYIVNLLNKCTCIINLLKISIFFFNIDLSKEKA